MVCCDTSPSTGMWLCLCPDTHCISFLLSRRPRRTAACVDNCAHAAVTHRPAMESLIHVVVSVAASWLSLGWRPSVWEGGAGVGVSMPRCKVVRGMGWGEFTKPRQMAGCERFQWENWFPAPWCLQVSGVDGQLCRRRPCGAHRKRAGHSSIAEQPRGDHRRTVGERRPGLRYLFSSRVR